MPIKNEIDLIPVAEIISDRDSRWRTKLDENNISVLAASIANPKQGLINPITVQDLDTRSWLLNTGEHRFEAFKRLAETHTVCAHEAYQNWTLIPARLAYDVTSTDLKILEIEENIRRAKMDWKDEVTAIETLHNLLMQEATGAEPWSMNKTGEFLNLSIASVSRAIAVSHANAAGDPRTLEATSAGAAYKVLARDYERKLDQQSNELSSATQVTVSSGGDIALAEPAPALPGLAASESRPFPESILEGNFLAWAPTYTGAKFNFGHFDFPYGIGWDKANKGSSNTVTKASSSQYGDTWKTYTDLCTTLCASWPRLFYPSSHFIFWLSSEHAIQDWTRKFFLEHGPESLRIESRPLIWHRSDNSGILADPDRGPRWVYETALLFTTGDRKIVKATSNLYSAPSGRAQRIHISEKPESVCRHFLKMLVDETTEFLDPTCGSGTALRAAESLGASRIQGYDLDPENVLNATQALNTSRRLRLLNEN